MASRAEIEARMADILNRDDFAARITVWFDRAYTSIQRRHNFKCMETTEQFSGTVGMYEVVAPTDIKESRLLYLYDPSTGARASDPFTETTLEEVRGALTSRECGCSPIYTIWYDSLIFAPQLVTNGLVLRYDYYRYRQPMDYDWFMTRAEDWLVYRGLAESAPFLAGDYRLAVWQAFAKEIWDELWKQDVAARTSLSPGAMQLRG